MGCETCPSNESKGCGTCATSGTCGTSGSCPVFGNKSTTDEVLKGVCLKGRHILVTGTSAGLGVETARALVAHGADVVGTVRDLSKGESATGAIHSAVEAGCGGSFCLVEMDLASLASVRKCADKLKSDARKFDVVICNAGVMACAQSKTVDGFELQFGTNFVGHFVFLGRIASLINDGGRVVTLSSSGHRFADVDLEDCGFAKTTYDPWVAYGRSKTADSLLAVEFDRRHRDRGVRAVAVHPGGIATELGRHMSPGEMEAMVKNLNEAAEKSGKAKFEWKSVPQGAATTVWAAVVAKPQEVGGRWCEDCGAAEISESGDLLALGVRSYAVDGERAKQLWLKGEELVGETF